MQAGFDQSSLMSDPKFKQQETMNQGNMVILLNCMYVMVRYVSVYKVKQSCT